MSSKATSSKPGAWLGGDRPTFQAPTAPASAPAPQTSNVTTAEGTTFLPTSSPNWRVEYVPVRLGDMWIDPELQRPEQPVEINKIVNEFNWGAFGVPHTSYREDTKVHALIDGQQRRAAALIKGYEDHLVLTAVHHHLSPADEARLFRQLNFRRAVTPVDLYKAALREGRPQALRAQEVLEPLGIKVAGGGNLTCIQTVLRLVARRNGQTNLAWALRMIQKIYGDGGANREIYDTAVVEAFFMINEEWGKLVDDDRFYERVSGFGAGLQGLQKMRGAALSIKGVKNGMAWQAVIDQVTAVYNKGLHHSSKRALPTWDRKRSTKVEKPETEGALESSST